MKKIAYDYFITRKGNCAQAVAAAWAHYHNVDQNIVAELSSCGRGKAPDGLCGALYAACLLAGENRKKNILEAFIEKSNGLSLCAEIRNARALNCSECVAHAAELLHNLVIREK